MASEAGGRFGGNAEAGRLVIELDIDTRPPSVCDPGLAAELLVLACDDRIRPDGVGLDDIDLIEVPAAGFAEFSECFSFLPGFRAAAARAAFEELGGRRVVFSRDRTSQRLIVDSPGDGGLPDAAGRLLSLAGARRDTGRTMDPRHYWPLPSRASALRPRRTVSTLADVLRTRSSRP